MPIAEIMKLEGGGTVTALPSRFHDREIDEKEELNKIALADARMAQSEPKLIGLASYIKQLWTAARQAKTDVETALYESSLQRQGRYTNSKLTEIKAQGGSEIFMGLTSVKCRACESWLDDAYGDYDSIWDIQPTPISDLPADLLQYIADTVQRKVMANSAELSTIESQKEMADYLIAETRKNAEKVATETSERMKLKMRDQMVEARFKEALKEVRSDIVTYKAGFLKGPIVRRKKQLKWQQNEETGQWTPISTDSLEVSYRRVSPFAMYPMPSATEINNGGLFEHHRLTNRDLVEMKDVPSFNSDAIDLVLSESKGGGLSNWLFTSSLWQEAERDIEQGKGTSSDTIDALEYWGDCQGSLLREWGLSEEEIPDTTDSYQVNVWLIGSYVIKAVLNSDKKGKKPYYKASFESIPGKFWGRGIPELMKDIQEKCNATARALVNNMALASGPFVMVDDNQMVEGQDYENIHPLKVFYYNSNKNYRGRDGISFNQPRSNARELLTVYDSFQQKADEYTGVPAYTYGMTSAVGGGVKTATGLSMMMQAASKAIKFVLSNIDGSIISPAIEKLYEFNMLFSDDNSIKGDLKVVAKGALSLVVKEQMQVRRTEFLSTLGTSPIYTEILGKRRIAYLLREVMKTLELPIDSLIPSDRELEVMEIEDRKMRQMMMRQQLAGGVAGSTPSGTSALPTNKGTPPATQTLDVGGMPAQGVDASLFMARQTG